MRRAERFFEIIQLLRSGRVITARQIAEKFEISERTVYRYMRDMLLSGVPIEGEAGVGYAIRGGYDLPPLMFTGEEIAALAIGARMVQAWGGHGHGKGASSALSKIESVLPPNLRKSLDDTRVYAPPLYMPADLKKRLDTIHSAITGHRRIALRYTDVNAEVSSRTVRPLGLFFWGKVWALTAWCELRGAFRNFRVDRMVSATVRKSVFKEEPGKTLEDYLRLVCETT